MNTEEQIALSFIDDTNKYRVRKIRDEYYFASAEGRQNLRIKYPENKSIYDYSDECIGTEG